jgi:glycosyltransferase involved in cell wall biosynthesis
MVPTSHGRLNVSAARPEKQQAAASTPELSVVIPCLDEAETLGTCIEKVRRVLHDHRISGEIIVADNGSHDESPAIARSLGVRLIHIEERGYGNALRGGIAAARGRYVITADADGSHDLAQIPALLAKLQEGHDLVIGNRFKGTIKQGAMAPLHRYFGTPLLAGISRLLFRSACGDQQCGFRGFSAAAFSRMRLRSSGMEFASEMVLKASCLGLSMAEIPTTQFPAQRLRPPHLRTWRDGWRHLRLMLLHSPRWLFFYPGVLLMISGLVVGAWLMPGPQVVHGIVFDIHTLLYAATVVLLGFQSISFAAFTKIYAIREGLLPEDLRVEKVLRGINLELGLVVGGALAVLGLAASLYAVGNYEAHHFGNLDPVKTMRVIIPATVSLTLGGQITLSSFFLSVLLLGRKPADTAGAPDGR